MPFVVAVYGGFMGSHAINLFGLDSRSSAIFNMHLLATRGYAVLFPDTPLERPGHTSEDLHAAVMPAVDAAIAQGIADPDRLAITGSSYGSYSTLVIIARTQRFKAAEITSVLHPDLVGGYLAADAVGGVRTAWFESGQWQLGGTPWEQPEAYRRTSPIFDFDRIATPVLIGSGDLDWAQPGPMATFVGLRRLGVPVEYRLYEADGHVMARRANVIDFWQRRLAFFAEHLDVAVDGNGAIIFDAGRARPRAATAP